MGRGKGADAEAVRSGCAWACMRRDPGYRAAWVAMAGPARFEAAAFPLRVQTRADLAAAQWGLAVWEDPDVEAWRTPFLPGMPALVAEPDPEPWPDPTLLLGMLGEAGARLEGLRLLNGRFVLKAELGDAALQILVPSERVFGPADGIVAKLGLSLPLEAPVGRIEDLWRVTARPPPPRRRRFGEAEVVGLTDRARRAKPLRSLLNHREGLCVFVDKPFVPMDNNRAELALRGAVIGVNRHSIRTPDRRAKLTPLRGTAEVVPVVNRGDPRGFV